jgi:hypothetical protein
MGIGKQRHVKITACLGPLISVYSYIKLRYHCNKKSKKHVVSMEVRRRVDIPIAAHKATN